MPEQVSDALRGEAGGFRDNRRRICALSLPYLAGLGVVVAAVAQVATVPQAVPEARAARRTIRRR